MTFWTKRCAVGSQVGVGWEGWQTARPAVSVLLILGAVVLVAKMAGFKVGEIRDRSGNDVRFFIAITIVLAFSLSCLGIGTEQEARQLKEIVLVVTGFYFGSKAGETSPPSNQASASTN
jgi:hypothetical protein